MSNILEEYLVKLGYENDEPSLVKMQGILARADKAVTTHASGITRRLLEVQSAIVGSFTSISAAILGTVDKVAMADQGYRLMGLRMLMTTDSARKLDMITKALGADLPTIIWDPELHRRAVGMSDDIDRMTTALGPDFEKRMLGVRDIRAEFSRLEIATKFLGMNFASKLFEKLLPGRDLDEKLDRLHSWVTEFGDKLPQIADKLSDRAIPVLRQTWTMIEGIVEVAKSGAIAFTNLIGAISGDTSIQGTQFSFDNLATAIQHVGDWLVKFETWLAHAEVSAGHFASAMALVLRGNWSGASEEFDKGKHSFDAPKAPGAANDLSGAPRMPELNSGVNVTSHPRPSGWRESIEEKTIGALDWLERFTHRYGLTKPLGDKKLREYTNRLEDKWFGSTPPQQEKAASPTVSQSFTLPEMPPTAASPTMESPATPAAGAPASSPSFMSRAALVDALSNAIAKFEAGDKADPVSRRNNNPGNLRWWGNYPVVNGYAKFPDWETGMEALRQQVRTNVFGRGLNLEQFFGGKPEVYPGFAPAKDENDPESYANTIGKWLGIDVHVPLNQVVPSARGGMEVPANVSSLLSILHPEEMVLPADLSRGLRGLISGRMQENAGWFNDVPRWISNPPSWYNSPAWINPGPSTSALQRDWSPAISEMQRPIAPSTSVNHDDHSVEIGDINIYITHPGADERTIERAVRAGIGKELDRQNQIDLTQLSPAY
ncbi:MAG TPA: hypothetical protein VN737_04120 [Bryobacteraceae bacterium]|nr:hypothetical protein [Bryobacteraceae bacterium]